MSDEIRGSDVQQKRFKLRQEAMILDRPRPMVGVLAAGCTLLGVIVGFSMGMVGRSATCHQHVPAAAVATPELDRARGFLGVEIRTDAERLEGDAELRAADAEVVFGARVLRVIPGTPAEGIGLEAGDLLVRVNGDRVADMHQLRDRIRQQRPGSGATVGFYRDGTYRTAGVRLTRLAARYH
jgi:membrane-associated protease RseP (regulator of RpoE activity)